MSFYLPTYYILKLILSLHLNCVIKNYYSKGPIMCRWGYFKSLISWRRDIFYGFFHLPAMSFKYRSCYLAQMESYHDPSSRKRQNGNICNRFAVRRYWNFVTAWQDKFACIRILAYNEKYYLKYLPPGSLLWLCCSWEGYLTLP